VADSKDTKVTMLEIPANLHARKTALGYKWRWVDIVEIGIGIAEKLLVEEDARRKMAQTSEVEAAPVGHP
jgi:hypothetical protein